MPSNCVGSLRRSDVCISRRCFIFGKKFSEIIRSFRRFKTDFRYTHADNFQNGLTETYRHTKISQYYFTGKELNKLLKKFRYCPLLWMIFSRKRDQKIDRVKNYKCRLYIKFWRPFDKRWFSDTPSKKSKTVSYRHVSKYSMINHRNSWKSSWRDRH